MNRALWAAQLFAGVFFLIVGTLHFIVPPGLPATMAWMYDLSPTLHMVSGTAEILGGLGLILPGVTGIMPRLVPLAALGLFSVMALGEVYHLGRGEYTNVVGNLFWLGLTAFIVWGRSTRYPLVARGM